MQWVTPGVGDAFRLVETALKETFVPALFRGTEKRRAGAKGHPPASQTGRTGPSRPIPDGP